MLGPRMKQALWAIGRVGFEQPEAKTTHRRVGYKTETRGEDKPRHPKGRACEIPAAETDVPEDKETHGPA